MDEIVDLLLAHGGTPRKDLFEYPHRADDSRMYIKEAQMLAEKIKIILEHLEAK